MWSLLKVRAPVPGGRPSVITLPYTIEPLPLISLPAPSSSSSSGPSNGGSGMIHAGSSALSPSATSPSSSTTSAMTSTSTSANNGSSVTTSTPTRSTSSGTPSMLSQELLKQRDLHASASSSSDGHMVATPPHSPSASINRFSPSQHLCACGVVSCTHGQLASSSAAALDPSMPSAQWDFSLPPTSRPPLMDLELSVLFEHLAPSNLITLINCILCEFNVVCISSRLSVLTPALESLMTLMFPLQWPFTYIPLLPTALNGVLGSPVPFIVGCLTEALDDLPCMPENAVIVDLDNNQIHAPPDPAGQPPVTPLQQQQPASPLPISPPSVNFSNARNTSKSATLPSGGMNGRRSATPTPPPPTPPSPGLTALLQHSAMSMSQSTSAIDSFRRLPWRLAWRLYDATTKHFNVFAQAHPGIGVNPPYYLPANARARRQGPNDSYQIVSPSPRQPYSPGMHSVHESSGSSSGSDTQNGSGRRSTTSRPHRSSLGQLPTPSNGIPVAAVMSIRTANVIYSGTSSDDSDPSGPERRYTNGGGSSPGSPSQTPPLSPRGSVINTNASGRRTISDHTNASSTTSNAASTATTTTTSVPISVSPMASAADEKVSADHHRRRNRSRSPASKKKRSAEDAAAAVAARRGRPHSNSFDETSGSRYIGQYTPSSRHSSSRVRDHDAAVASSSSSSSSSSATTTITTTSTSIATSNNTSIGAS
jgi:hypothetical protein